MTEEPRVITKQPDGETSDRNVGREGHLDEDDDQVDATKIQA